MKALKEALTPLAILLLSGVVVYDHVVARPAAASAPAVNGTALGKAYAPALLASYADAWSAAAKALEDGKSIAEAQKTLQENWKEARIKAFTAEVAPGFAAVLPEGTEPANAAKRAQVADLWRSFAKGLKGGH